ncbi:hypothetical protein V8G54_015966 [Vigna mungo]|uniref:Clavata3/ESR (CLE) gene family member n=1 Tax=Vigna mungo TaxID=3915 RepID=A0AAQ3NM94_VIGMU
MRFGEVSDHIDVMYQIQSLLLHILGTILNIPFLATNPLLLYSPLFPSFPTLFPSNNITNTSSSSFPPSLSSLFIGKMRIGEFILVCFVLLWACIGSNTVARKTAFVSNFFDGAKKKTNTVSYADNAHKCNGNHHLSCYGNNITVEDKRLVPTGPNPLHNR